MQRLKIEKSLQHVFKTFGSEWRMLVKICWLPFVLYSGMEFLTNYLQHGAEDLDNYYALRQVRVVLKSLLQAVFMVGIYRYLLQDHRFRIRTFPLRTDLHTGKPTLSTPPFYFTLDKAVVIFALLVLGLERLKYYSHYFMRQWLSDYLISNYRTVTFWDILPIELWQGFLMLVGFLLCLVFPYMAVSRAIKLGTVWQQIKALKGNRIRASIVQGCILGYIYVAKDIISRFLRLLRDHGFLGTNYNGWRWATEITLYAALSFICLALLVIFCASIFKPLGVQEDSSQT